MDRKYLCKGLYQPISTNPNPKFQVTDFEIRSDAVQGLRKILKLAKESSNLENIKAEAMEISKQNTLLTAALQN